MGDASEVDEKGENVIIELKEKEKNDQNKTVIKVVDEIQDGDPVQIDEKGESVVIHLENIDKSDENETKNVDDSKMISSPRSHHEQNYQTYQEPYSQNYYPRSNYQQSGTPVHHQRLDGQSVYYEAPPPYSVSRGGLAYHVNEQNEPDHRYFYRDPEIFGSGFDSVRIRNRFVQRVYTLLTLQLLVTFGFILLVIFDNDIRSFFRRHSLVIMLCSMFLFLMVYMVLVCCENLRRTSPLNFILLSLLTFLMTMMLSSISAFAETKIVLYAIGTTALVCLVVSLFACQTKWDVTGCGMCLCIATLVLVLFGMIIMIMHLCGYKYKILDIVYSSIATLLFCFWLMYDTQQIVGGKRIELSPEEYIVGASFYASLVLSCFGMVYPGLWIYCTIWLKRQRDRVWTYRYSNMVLKI